MAKDKTSAEEPVEAAEEMTKIEVLVPPAKAYAFEVWAKHRGKKKEELRGLKAFLGTKASYRFPLEKWDELTSSY
jgi:hypothetical protein